MKARNVMLGVSLLFLGLGIVWPYFAPVVESAIDACPYLMMQQGERAGH
jgi:hypothetical protein